MDVSNSEDESEIVLDYGPETRAEWTERLKSTLKAGFNKVNAARKQSNMFVDYGQQNRAILDIVTAVSKKLSNPLVTGQYTVTSWKADGGILKITWKCLTGQCGDWSSLKVLCKKKEQYIYSNTMIITAGIFITGNSCEKFSLLCKFLGLACVSRSTNMIIRKKYVIPEMERFWKDMKASIWNIFKGESIILCGDGRNDSPGHSTKYCQNLWKEL